MAKKLPTYYWDTSIFLMVLKGETDKGQDALDGAIHLLREVQLRRAVIIASQIVVAEVLPGHHADDAWGRFHGWLEWEYLHLHDVNPPLVRRAAKIRNDLLFATPSLKVGVADAVHLATAVIHKDILDAVHGTCGHFKRGLPRLGLGLEASLPDPPPFREERLEAEGAGPQLALDLEPEPEGEAEVAALFPEEDV